jgi:hypothetical protein
MVNPAFCKHKSTILQTDANTNRIAFDLEKSKVFEFFGSVKSSGYGAIA